jgi:hypothetical protein
VLNIVTISADAPKLAIEHIIVKKHATCILALRTCHLGLELAHRNYGTPAVLSETFRA